MPLLVAYPPKTMFVSPRPLLSFAFCERPSALQARFDLSLVVPSLYVACRWRTLISYGPRADAHDFRGLVRALSASNG